MGAGRRTQTFLLNDIAVSSPNQAASTGNFRDLRKSHLGGVIFGCKNSTLKECLFKQLFGQSFNSLATNTFYLLLAYQYSRVVVI